MKTCRSIQLPTLLACVVGIAACGDDGGGGRGTGETDGSPTSTGMDATGDATTDSAPTTGDGTTGGGSGGGTGGTDPTTGTGGGGSCDDGSMNGDETDVDCGGAVCDPCADDQMCLVDTDCVVQSCVMGTCRAPACDDTVQNGDETDVDCGGTCPNKCADDQMCMVDGDCESDFCDAGTCKPAICQNTSMDGDETDVDCGGTVCSPCDDGQMCLVGTDCVSGVCDAMTMTCAAPACDDSVLNGDETDVDCGGPTCEKCEDNKTCTMDSDCLSARCQADSCVPGECGDMTLNGSETDVDCGGSCAPCDDGLNCLTGSDCLSKVCDMTDLTCTAPSCMDTVQNGDETDVNCGGMTCDACQVGEMCLVADDCVTLVCDPSGNVCVDAGCSDMVQNGDETDQDCGGSCGATCDTGETCVADADCISDVCDTAAAAPVCLAAACDDGRENGDETDVDCGGSCVEDCADGEKCDGDGDCISGVCDSNLCAAPTCNDGVQNGSEAGVDCGGGCDAPCKLGSEDTINTTTPEFQLRPAVAAAPNGSYYVVVWASGSFDKELRGRRFDASGNALDANDFVVNTTGGGDADFAAVAAYNGGFTVTWVYNVANEKDIRARLFDSDGVAQGNDFVVNTTTSGSQDKPDIGMHPSNGAFVICWHSEDQDAAGGFGVYCRRYDNAGVGGGEIAVNATTAGNQTLPSVAMDQTGAYTVVFQGEDADGSGVFRRRFDNADGALDGADVAINTTTTAEQTAPQIGMNPGGAFVVAWTSPDAELDGVVARRYDAAGAAQSGEFTVNAFTNKAQLNPAVAVNTAGQFMIVWQSDDQDGNRTGVYGQRYNADGTVLGGEFLVNSTRTGFQENPDLAFISAAVPVVVWDGGLQTDKDVFSQRFSAF